MPQKIKLTAEDLLQKLKHTFKPATADTWFKIYVDYHNQEAVKLVLLSLLKNYVKETNISACLRWMYRNKRMNKDKMEDTTFLWSMLLDRAQELHHLRRAERIIMINKNNTTDACLCAWVAAVIKYSPQGIKLAHSHKQNQDLTLSAHHSLRTISTNNGFSTHTPIISQSLQPATSFQSSVRPVDASPVDTSPTDPSPADASPINAQYPYVQHTNAHHPDRTPTTATCTQSTNLRQSNGLVMFAVTEGLPHLLQIALEQGESVDWAQCNNQGQTLMDLLLLPPHLDTRLLLLLSTHMSLDHHLRYLQVLLEDQSKSQWPEIRSWRYLPTELWSYVNQEGVSIQSLLIKSNNLSLVDYYLTNMMNKTIILECSDTQYSCWYKIFFDASPLALYRVLAVLPYTNIELLTQLELELEQSLIAYVFSLSNTAYNTLEITEKLYFLWLGIDWRLLDDRIKIAMIDNIASELKQHPHAKFLPHQLRCLEALFIAGMDMFSIRPGMGDVSLFDLILAKLDVHDGPGFLRSVLSCAYGYPKNSLQAFIQRWNTHGQDKIKSLLSWLISTVKNSDLTWREWLSQVLSIYALPTDYENAYNPFTGILCIEQYPPQRLFEDNARHLWPRLHALASMDSMFLDKLDQSISQQYYHPNIWRLVTGFYQPALILPIHENTNFFGRIWQTIINRYKSITRTSYDETPLRDRAFILDALWRFYFQAEKISKLQSSDKTLALSWFVKIFPLSTCCDIKSFQAQNGMRLWQSLLSCWGQLTASDDIRLIFLYHLFNQTSHIKLLMTRGFSKILLDCLSDTQVQQLIEYLDESEKLGLEGLIIMALNFFSEEDERQAEVGSRLTSSSFAQLVVQAENRSSTVETSAPISTIDVPRVHSHNKQSQVICKKSQQDSPQSILDVAVVSSNTQNNQDESQEENDINNDPKDSAASWTIDDAMAFIGVSEEQAISPNQTKRHQHKVRRLASTKKSASDLTAVKNDDSKVNHSQRRQERVVVSSTSHLDSNPVCEKQRSEDKEQLIHKNPDNTRQSQKNIGGNPDLSMVKHSHYHDPGQDTLFDTKCNSSWTQVQPRRSRKNYSPIIVGQTQQQSESTKESSHDRISVASELAQQSNRQTSLPVSTKAAHNVMATNSSVEQMRSDTQLGLFTGVTSMHHRASQSHGDVACVTMSHQSITSADELEALHMPLDTVVTAYQKPNNTTMTELAERTDNDKLRSASKAQQHHLSQEGALPRLNPQWLSEHILFCCDAVSKHIQQGINPWYKSVTVSCYLSEGDQKIISVMAHRALHILSQRVEQGMAKMDQSWYVSAMQQLCALDHTQASTAESIDLTSSAQALAALSSCFYRKRTKFSLFLQQLCQVATEPSMDYDRYDILMWLEMKLALLLMHYRMDQNSLSSDHLDSEPQKAPSKQSTLGESCTHTPRLQESKLQWLLSEPCLDVLTTWLWGVDLLWMNDATWMSLQPYSRQQYHHQTWIAYYHRVGAQIDLDPGQSHNDAQNIAKQAMDTKLDKALSDVACWSLTAMGLWQDGAQDRVLNMLSSTA